MKLHIERRSPFNIDPNIAHQQTAIAILRVTFVCVAKQQMSSLRAEDLTIQTPPHNAFLVLASHTLDNQVRTVVVVVAAASAWMAAAWAATAPTEDQATVVAKVIRRASE